MPRQPHTSLITAMLTRRAYSFIIAHNDEMPRHLHGQYIA